MRKKFLFMLVPLCCAIFNIKAQQDSVIYTEEVMMTVEKTTYAKLKQSDTVFTPLKEIAKISDIRSVVFLSNDSLVEE